MSWTKTNQLLVFLQTEQHLKAKHSNDTTVDTRNGDKIDIFDEEERGCRYILVFPSVLPNALLHRIDGCLLQTERQRLCCKVGWRDGWGGCRVTMEGCTGLITATLTPAANSTGVWLLSGNTARRFYEASVCVGSCLTGWVCVWGGLQ